VNGEASNVIRVSFERCHFLSCVVVEDSEMEIVRTANEPILARDEPDTSYWYFGNFKSLDHGLEEIREMKLDVSWNRKNEWRENG